MKKNIVIGIFLILSCFFVLSCSSYVEKPLSEREAIMYLEKLVNRIDSCFKLKHDEFPVKECSNDLMFFQIENCDIKASSSEIDSIVCYCTSSYQINKDSISIKYININLCYSHNTEALLRIFNDINTDKQDCVEDKNWKLLYKKKFNNIILLMNYYGISKKEFEGKLDSLNW